MSEISYIGGAFVFLILIPIVIIMIGSFLSKQCGPVIACILIAMGCIMSFGLFCSVE